MHTIGVAASIGVLLAAAPAFGEEWEFLLTNATGKRIVAVELAPSSSSRWQFPKRDPDATPAPFVSGARQSIAFDKDHGTCLVDLRARFADGTLSVWPRIDLCQLSYVTLRYSHGAPSFFGN